MQSVRTLAIGLALIMASLAAAPALEVTSGLGRRLYALPDNGTIAAARRQVQAHPSDPKLVLALSLAEAGQRQYREAVATDTRGLAAAPADAVLLLERGHRELGLREFAAAQRDLDRATQLDPMQLQAHYHQGLAHYFQGQFAAAAESFRQARDLARSNDDLIDCSNWLYVSLRRAGEEKTAEAVLERIGPGVTNTEPHLAFYLRLIRFYQGKLPEAQLLPPKPKDPSDTEAELSYDTVAYGLGNWHLYNKDESRQRELFRSVVGGEAWNAWGFVGSETELIRLASKR